MADEQLFSLEISTDLEELAIAMLSLLSRVSEFPEERRLDQLFGEWSLKDVLAHLIAWNDLTASSLIHVKNGTTTEIAVVSNDNFNAAAVKESSPLDWDTVFSRFVDSCVKLGLGYSQLTPEQIAIPVVAIDSTTPAYWVREDILHFNAHANEIETVKATLIVG